MFPSDEEIETTYIDKSSAYYVGLITGAGMGVALGFIISSLSYFFLTLS